MSNLNRKTLIIMVCAVLAVAGIIAAVIIINGNSGDKKLNATVVDLINERQAIEEYIVKWNSSSKTHSKGPSNAKCTITINNNVIAYDDFNEGWIAATTEYKNKGDLKFTLYADWIADENGIFGENGSDGESYINGSGGLLIKNWNKDFTINFNGYKIDRNMADGIESYGSVIKVDESENVYFKNGCITGGSNLDDGGGVLIYGKYKVFFDNMTVTGNVTGNNGGGIYVGSHAKTYLTDTIVEGNYAENYGGGMYGDYKKDDKSVNLSEVVTITNNVGSDNRNNLTLHASSNSSCARIFGADLSEGSSIYVSLSRCDSKSRTILDADNYDSDNDKYFHSDNPNYEIYSIWLDDGTSGTSTSCDGLAIKKK